MAITAGDPTLLGWLVNLGAFIAVFGFKVVDTPYTLQVTGLAWLAFIVYWGYSGRRDAKKWEEQKDVKASESFFSRIFRVFLLSTSAGVVNLTDGTNHLPIPFFIVRFIGWSLILWGVGYAFWARATIAEQWRAQVEIRADHKLVSNGPYGITRHPIYTGLLALSLGCVLVAGVPFIGLAGFLTHWFMWNYKIGQEEKFLVQMFGQQYVDYRKRVPKLVPGVHFI